MPQLNLEKLQRALVYWAKTLPRFRDERYTIDKLKAEARKAIAGQVKPPLGHHGSWNHAAVKMACAGVINGDWSQAREFFADIKAAGMNEYGPLYWILTYWCCEWCAEFGPADVQADALGLMAFIDKVNGQSLIRHPARLELIVLDKVVGHEGRPLVRVGSGYVATSAQRSIFPRKEGKLRFPSLGWQLENIATARHFALQTPRTVAYRNDALTFKDSDASFDAGVAYAMTRQSPGNSGDFKLTTQMDWVLFADGSLLIATGTGDHSTKPPIRVVDAEAGGVCRFLSPVPYATDRHLKPSLGEVVVHGGQVFGVSSSEASTQRSRERPLSSVLTWTRLTKGGSWQRINPETQQPESSPPPTTPPTTPPTQPPADTTPVERAASNLLHRALVLTGNHSPGPLAMQADPEWRERLNDADLHLRSTHLVRQLEGEG